MPSSHRWALHVVFYFQTCYNLWKYIIFGFLSDQYVVSTTSLERMRDIEDRVKDAVFPPVGAAEG